MATRAVIRFVLLEHLYTEMGVWCDDCMLGSAGRVWLVSQVQYGPLRLSVGNKCFDCGRWF